jgi:hypothetical protein
VTYYVLSQTAETYNIISQSLVEDYKSLRRGERLGKKGTKKGGFEYATGVGLSMYAVMHVAPIRVMKCEANPFNLCCSHCTGFDHDGICSHVLAITHIIMSEKPRAKRDHLCNLEYLLSTTGSTKKKKTGRFGDGSQHPMLARPKALDKPAEKQKEQKEMTTAEKRKAKGSAYSRIYPLKGQGIILAYISAY